MVPINPKVRFPDNLPDNAQKRRDRPEDNAKLTYHVLSPADLHSDSLEGMSPTVTASYLSAGISKLLDDRSISLSSGMKAKLKQLKNSLEYSIKLDSIDTGRVTRTQAEKLQEADKLAIYLSSDMRALETGQIDSPYLYMGGFARPLGTAGHAVSYEVIRQDNGKLQLTINNTDSGFDSNSHRCKKGTIRALIYKDLKADDLNKEFWRTLAEYKTGAISIKGLEPIYKHIQVSLHGKIPVEGRVMKVQKTGVCAWKSLTTWLHGQIAPGETAASRSPDEELVYLKLKRILIDDRLTSLENEKSVLNSSKILISYYNFSSFLTAVYLIITKAISCFGLMSYKPCSLKKYKILPQKDNVTLLTTELQKKRARIDKKIQLFMGSK